MREAITGYNEQRTKDEEGWWRAVLERDRQFDGAFVYAVRSTGVYCRPSCPSRRPHREQVLFFPLAEAAEQSGFRPCQRCHPRDVAARDPQAELVQRVCRYVESNLEGRLTLEALSAEANVSPYHLQRVFKRIMGITPRQYVEMRRLNSLKAELRNGKSVTAALYDAGYSSNSRLYERSSSQLGMTPGTYRRGGRGMQIRYAIVESSLGRLLVAATERGVCAVSLGDSDALLEAALREEYPAAEIERDHRALEGWVQAFLDHLGGQIPYLDLPLDVRGTAFQWRVWDALRSIPYGSTRTYGEIARDLGNPAAARAVARACATNPAAIAIPCHRAVREDGGLGGYRWGLERKEALLAGEQRASMAPAQVGLPRSQAESAE